MIKKLAVLVIEKADGAVEIRPGEKGEIYATAREEKRRLNGEASHNVVRLTAFGSDGIIIQAKWKSNLPASTPAVEVVETVDPPADDAGDDDAEGPDAEDIRAKLKEKGIKVPPRITIDNLIKLAIDNGVEV